MPLQGRQRVALRRDLGYRAGTSDSRRSHARRHGQDSVAVRMGAGCIAGLSIDTAYYPACRKGLIP
jgi:hypothetical protein